MSPRQRSRSTRPALSGEPGWCCRTHSGSTRTPALLPTARLLAAHGEARLTDELAAQLGRISIASVQRQLTRLAQDTPRLPGPGPERANRVNQVARQVPMRRIAWDEAAPRHFEVDLVPHSGSVTDGEYLHTMQLVDVATGWSERVAVLGRSQQAADWADPGMTEMR